ncbi:MAG: type II restriction enzyme [Candidatus Thorarchaeota archaeon]
MGKKRETLRELFLELREESKDLNFIPFDNDQVKVYARQTGFRNPFDVVKHDIQATLPEEMIDEDYFIVHLGGGNHAFVRGADCGFNGFHSFENIPQKHRIAWPFKPSVLDVVSQSETQTISTVYNEGIIGDFLVDDKNADVLYHAGRRAKASFYAEACPGIGFDVKSLQLEADAFFEIREIKGEHPLIIASVEAKKTNATEFEVRQVYTAMRYLRDWTETGEIPVDAEVHNLYVVKDSPDGQAIGDWYHVRIYDYYFRDPMVMSTIRLRKAREYQLHYDAINNGAAKQTTLV